MAYKIMAYIVMAGLWSLMFYRRADVVMAYTVMAYIAMAGSRSLRF